MSTRRDRTYGEFDAATLRQAVAGPGMDPRQWVSLGAVDPDEGSQRSVRYDVPKYGTLVHVTLQPSGIPVVCRVSSQCAGSGEADIEPFAAGDEVVILIPEGDERSNCVIIGRLNNALSLAPTVVAGTQIQNNVSAKRRIGPILYESNTAITFRIAQTKSYLSLSQDGNITATTGDGSYIHIGADMYGYQNSDATMVMQANQNTHEWRIDSQSSAGTTLTRFGGANPGIHTTTTFFIDTQGQGAWQHLVTFEQVVALLAQVIGSLGSTPTTPLSPLTTPSATTGGSIVAAALALVPPLTTIPTLTPTLLQALIAGTSTQNQASGKTGLCTGILAS